MKHKEFSEMMILSLYGELSDEQDARLRGHLSSCSECSNELETLENLHSALSEESSEIPEYLLWQARDALFQRLRRETDKSPDRRPWTGLLGGTMLNWATAGASMALVLVGFLLGYLTFAGRSDSELDPFGSEDVRITNLRLDEDDGEVQLTFQAAREFSLKGNMEDQRIHRFLAHALLNEQNTGVRLLAVNTFRDQAPVTTDKQVQRALVIALRRDENPAVRQHALSALQQYSFDEEIRDALLHVLMYDENAKLRIEAINTLEMALTAGQKFEPDVLGVLEQKGQNDENKYIRLRAREVLEEIEPQFF
jgi:hypothetical protein